MTNERIRLAIWMVFFLSLNHYPVNGHVDFMIHVNASGTQLGRPDDDPNFYFTHSNLPHLPRLNGFVGSHGAYRHLSVTEQTFTMIGEPKHGLWRMQESGFIREYRKAETKGISEGVDPNDWDNLDSKQKNIVLNDYAHFIPEEGRNAYRYPDQRIENGVLNFIDLTIYHPKYARKYEDHVAIDLAHFACTMSQANFPHVNHLWKYVVAQPKANQIGPLGKRAGLDVRENYLNVLQMHMFDDTNFWANIGIGNTETDISISSVDDMEKRGPQTINYQILDMNKIDYEVYLFERPFMNQPYLFVTVVMENKKGSESVFAYLRPKGLYWDELQKRKLGTNTNNLEKHFLQVNVKDDPAPKTAYPLPVYGMHSPNRSYFGLTGGACPARGGDIARYPWGSAGSWWPTILQESTPLCDAILIDIRTWANLWASWTDETIGNGNSGFGTLIVNYTVAANVYGIYTDPYLTKKNKTNPTRLVLTSDGKLVERDGNDLIDIPLQFAKVGTLLDYTPLPDLETTAEPEQLDKDVESKTPPWATGVIFLQAITLLILLMALLRLRYKQTDCCNSSQNLCHTEDGSKTA